MSTSQMHSLMSDKLFVINQCSFLAGFSSQCLVLWQQRRCLSFVVHLHVISIDDFLREFRRSPQKMHQQVIFCFVLARRIWFVSFWFWMPYMGQVCIKYDACFYSSPKMLIAFELAVKS